MATFLDFFTNIIATDPQATQFGTLKDFAALQTNQKSYLTNTLKSDRLNFSFTPSGNIKYSNGYDSNVINYQPDYTNPAKSVNFVAQMYGLPASTTLELTNAANENKGNPTFLKNALAFIGKNWQQILTGVVTVSTAIKYGSQTNAQGFDANINPNTGLQWGEIPNTQAGTNSGISTQTLLIGGGLLAGIYLITR
jgi:hypothetical protein